MTAAVAAAVEFREQASTRHVPPFLSARTVARFLGVRRAKVYGHCAAGTWPGTRRVTARRWRIRTRAFVAWYAAHLHVPEREALADLAMFLPHARGQM